MVIGVWLYLFLVPRGGSVDYHKRKYVEAHQWGVVGEWIITRGPTALRDLYWRQKTRRIDFHRNALLDARYLVEREFDLFNRSADELVDDLNLIRFEMITGHDPAGVPLFTKAATNRIRVLGCVIDMDKWGRVIRQADNGDGRINLSN